MKARLTDGDWIMLAAVPTVALYGLLTLTPMLVAATVLATIVGGATTWLLGKLT